MFVKGLLDLGVGLLCLGLRLEVYCTFVLLYYALCWFIVSICIVHIVGVHLFYLVWISSVHTAKCIIGVHLHCFLFDILTWAFMSKLRTKLHPIKNFKCKYLLGDKILKGDGAFSSYIHDDVLFSIPFAMELRCEVMDLVLA